MISPLVAFFGSFTRGFAFAIVLLPQPPQPPMVTLTSALAM